MLIRTWTRKGNRLAMYGEHPDEEFWASEWEEATLDELMKQAQGRRHVLKLFYKHLPRQGKILEAGCGLGQWVKLLRGKGYDISGIDSSERTIEMANKIDASLPLTVGNVLALDYPDEYLAGYISLGVAEHFEEGPEKLLLEAKRVLKPGGMMMIAVPYFNPLRRFKFRNSNGHSAHSDFYQYAFTIREFGRILKKQGFKPLAVLPFGRYGIDTEGGFSARTGAAISKYKKNKVIGGVRTLLKTAVESRPAMFMIGHMFIYAARKF